MNDFSQISPQQLAQVYRQALKKGLSLDRLESKISKKFARMEASQKVEKRDEKQRVKKMKHSLPPVIRYGALILPIVFLGVGAYLLGSAILPIAQYYTATLPGLDRNNLVAPIPNEQILDVTPLVIAQTVGRSARNSNGPVILDTELDYTNLSNWFADARSQALAESDDGVVYTLNIPAVNIENAEVKIGGTDLNESLIAYPGTALPGESGAPVIFGHSVLRQFYNPNQTNPRRYNSIFSYIMTLKTGDEIFLTHEDAEYRYVVREKTEVKPEDTYILSQQHDNRQLKLVTCVPEGTYLRRGVIVAELVTN